MVKLKEHLHKSESNQRHYNAKTTRRIAHISLTTTQSSIRITTLCSTIDVCWHPISSDLKNEVSLGFENKNTLFAVIEHPLALIPLTLLIFKILKFSQTIR